MNDTINTISFVAGIISLITGIIFFISGNRAQNKAIKLLDETKKQVESLQKISERWLDKYTDYFTSQKSNTVSELFNVFKEIQVTTTQAQKQLTDDKVTTDTVLTQNIIIYYYTAITNLLTVQLLNGATLPDLLIDSTETMLNKSHEIHTELEKILKKEETKIKDNPYFKLYKTASEIEVKQAKDINKRTFYDPTTGKTHIVNMPAKINWGAFNFKKKP